MLPTLHGSRLIGRGDVLAAVETALSRVPGAGGAVVLGAPGTGKTRILQHVVETAEQRGWTPVVAQPSDAMRQLPLEVLATAMGSAGLDLPSSPAKAAETLSYAHQKSPVVVCIDDAHLVDRTTAGLLLHLARKRVCHLLVGLPQDAPVPEEIRALWKDGWLPRVTVPPLPAGKIGAVCDAMLAGPVEFTTASRFAMLAQGNLVLLRELLHATAEQKALTQQNGLWVDQRLPDIPGRLHDLVLPRLRGLTDDQRGALELLCLAETASWSVVGQWAAAADWEALESRGLVEVDDRRAHTDLSVPDLLMRNVVVQLIPRLRRRRLLTQLIGTFERAEPTAPRRVVQLVTWRLHVGEAVSEGALLHAARQAWWTHDWATAQRLADTAWRVHRSPAAGLLLSKVLLHQGRHGQITELAQCLTAAQGGSHVAEANDTVHRSRITRFGSGTRTGAAPTAERTELDTAVVALVNGDWETGLKTVRPLLEGRDPRRAAMAGAVALAALLHLGRPQDCLSLEPALTRAMSGLDQADIPEYDVANIPALLAYARGLTGDRETAVEQLREHVLHASMNRNTMVANRAGVMLAHLLFEQGEIGEAHRIYSTASARDDIIIVQQLARCGAVITAVHLGDVQAVDRAVARLSPFVRSSPHDIAEIDIALATHEMYQGRMEAAVNLLRLAGNAALRRGAHASLARVVHALTRVGRADLAVRMCGPWTHELQGELDRLGIDFAHAMAAGSAERVNTCAQRWEESGAPLYAAEAWASVSRLHRAADDPRRATAAARRCAATRVHHKGAPTFLMHAVEEHEALTHREREIALLAAGGHKSHEIAERASLSVRTVENHLYRIYKKLGVANRRALRDMFARGMATDSFSPRAD
ncbi:LuxR family transcriptional regulator [Streptomyces sp. NPDC047108]|uniref:LuxR family transcriptional regulator n=1 Tax=Streptomyces sp. NPDC047108 TaxID=3155025 RepID=UPI0033E54B4C